MIVPVPKPEGLSLSDFTEFLYNAFFASRFPSASGAPEPMPIQQASPGIRLAWRAVAETALKLAPQVRAAELPAGPTAMYQQPRI